MGKSQEIICRPTNVNKRLYDKAVHEARGLRKTPKEMLEEGMRLFLKVHSRKARRRPKNQKAPARQTSTRPQQQTRQQGYSGAGYPGQQRGRQQRRGY